MMKAPSREVSQERKIESSTSHTEDHGKLDITREEMQMRQQEMVSRGQRGSFDGERGKQPKAHDFRSAATSLAERQEHLDRQHKAGKSRERGEIQMESASARRDSYSSDDAEWRYSKSFEHQSLLEEGRAHEIDDHPRDTISETNERLKSMQGEFNERLSGVMNELGRLAGMMNEMNRLAGMGGDINRLTGTTDQMNTLLREVRTQTTRSRWDTPDRATNTIFSVTGGIASIIGLGYTLKAFYA